ncbi:MAG: cytochrome c [Burkholderiaceae bacterium]
MTRRARVWAALLAVPLLAALVVGGAWLREAWMASRPAAGGPLESANGQAVPVTPAMLERGAYLARIANCAGCHSVKGQPPMAGGLALGTPFGTLYSSNLTPDPETGLGRWTADQFWDALHQGRGREGRLLYPAFPYTSYTGMTRADSDAIFAWLRQLPPEQRVTPEHQLGWPYRMQSALAVWRLMYFRAGDAQTPGGAVSAAPKDRGRYLVEAVGHCAECHAPRNRLGALRDAPGLRGGWVGVQGWVAPSLADPREAGVQDWRDEDVRQWLRSGWSAHGAALGPMADVVAESLQFLSDGDAAAISAHLRGLPREQGERPAFEPAPAAQMALGRQVYDRHCVDCHGDQGQGRRIDGQPAYPPLAGNRGVTQLSSQNVLQVLANGAFAPVTPGHRRPYGMPPMRQVLSTAEMAAVASMIRQSWGNQASAVDEQAVMRLP